MSSVSSLAEKYVTQFKSYCKRMGWKRFLIMLFGNIIIGLGIAVFRWADLGTDPFSGMNIAIAAHLPISYPLYQICFNIAAFIIEFIFARRKIGIGTFLNAIFLGYFCSFFYMIIEPLFGATSGSMVLSILGVVLGLLICSFGLSLYQTPDVGVSPYDSLALILYEKFPKIPYFWIRISVDATCALICFLAGGVVGLGTLVCSFGLGPVISFFNNVFTKKIVTPMKHKD